MTQIQQSSIWITGASSGIGEALALACAAKGARLILSARRPEELERVRDLCCAQAGCSKENIAVVPLDLQNPESLEAAWQQVEAQHGAPDIVVHNGGISQRALGRDTETSVVRSVMETNFFGAVQLNRFWLPHASARGSGHIVVISSLVGLFGTPLRSAYSASKHAMHGYFDAIRAEEHDQGIKVTIVCPGFIKTAVSLNAVTADGSKHNQMDDAQNNAMSAEDCAARIVRGIENEEAQFVVARGKEAVGPALKRFAPALLRRVLRSAKVT